MNEDLIATFSLVQVLLVVVTIQLVAAGVAAFYLGKPGLAVLGASIQAATAAAVAILLVLPGAAGPLMAVIFAAAIGISVFHMTSISIKKGNSK